MANRTPGLQDRNQYHRNWGNYTDGGQTTPANGDLPNQPSNPLSNPEFSKLEAGDLAYVTTTDAGVYYCVSPGTVGGGDAIWTQLAAGGAVVQTIRDAHQIVVGQSSAPYSNVVSQDADVLDPGDGTGLETALANATALVVGGYTGVDVRVRPCNITLVPASLATVPLTIGADVRLIGAGREQSLITGGDGTGVTSQAIFSLSVAAQLEGFRLSSPAPAVGPAAANGVVELIGGSNKVRDCRIGFSQGGTPRVTGAMIAASGLGTRDAEITDCRFDLNDLLDNSGIPAIAVQLGVTGAFARQTQGATVSNCVVQGGQQAVRVLNTELVTIHNVSHYDAVTPPGSISHEVLTNPGDGQSIGGLRISDFYLSVTNADDAARQGILINQQATDEELLGTVITNVQMRWDSQNPINGRDGMLILCGDNGVVRSVLVSNVHMESVTPGQSVEYGFHADLTTGPDALLQEWRISNCYVDAAEIDGVFLEGTGVGEGSAERTGISNCSFPSSGNAGVTVEENMSDTIVLGNNFGGSFSGLSDAGTGTEAAHNID